MELRRIGDNERKDRIWYFVTSLDEARLKGLPQQPARAVVGSAGPPPPAVDLLDGWTLHVRAASVPGGDGVTLDRSAFFASADGIIFVADARANRVNDNLSALHDLSASLLSVGNDGASLPTLFQINHTHDPNARPAARVLEELDVVGSPHVEALARQGRGVIESFDTMRDIVLARLIGVLSEGPAAVPVLGLNAATRDRDVRAVLAQLPMVHTPRVGLATPAVVEIQVPTSALIGLRAVQVVRAELSGQDVRVDLLARTTDTPSSGADSRPGTFGLTRRTTLILRAAETDTPAPPRPEPTLIPAWARAPQPPPPRERDIPPLAYGALGILAGLTSGYLLGYVVFG